jgi:hypothetical protein
MDKTSSKIFWFPTVASIKQSQTPCQQAQIALQGSTRQFFEFQSHFYTMKK